MWCCDEQSRGSVGVGEEGCKFIAWKLGQKCRVVGVCDNCFIVLSFVFKSCWYVGFQTLLLTSALEQENMTSLSFGSNFSACALSFRRASFVLDFSLLAFLYTSCRLILFRILETFFAPILFHGMWGGPKFLRPGRYIKTLNFFHMLSSLMASQLRGIERETISEFWHQNKTEFM